MSRIRLYTLLGVSTPEEAAERWPRDLVRPFVGVLEGGRDALYRDLMIHLQDALELRGLRPGADGDRLGLVADVHVTPPPVALPLVMAQLPEVAFHLRATANLPATLFVTRGPGGALEVAIQGLPVAMHLPPGFVQPLYTDEELAGVVGDPPDKLLTDAFEPDHADSLEIVASESGPTRVSVRVNVRLTETGDFLFDTVVPLSIGACKLSGLPCRGLHDVQLIPTPRPRHVEYGREGPEVALEWARHDISIADTDASSPGLITIRTIDLDTTRGPLKGLAERIHARRPEADPVELVLEDVALPFRTAPPLPIPTHGRFHLRRSIVAGDAGGETWDLRDAPVEIEVRGTYLKLFRLMLQTPGGGESPAAFDVKWSDSPDDPTGALQGEVTLTDGGELLVGALNPAPVTFLRVLGAHVRLGALRFGVSLKKVFDGDDDAWTDVLALLGDFQNDTVRDGQIFELQDASGKPGFQVLHDVGWAFGKPSLGSLYDPDGLDFVFADKLRLRIEELGLVTENNGGLYLLVTAGLSTPLGEATPPEPAEVGAPAAPATTASADDARRKGFGLRLHRLRMLLARSSDTQAPWLLDGISFFARKGKFELAGMGMVSEYDQGANHHREIGIELSFRFDALGRTFDLGGQFLHGRVTGADEFTYLLLALSFGRLPLGATELANVRVLFTSNLTPRLSPPDGHGQSMRLFRWYKQNGDAIAVPLSRKLTAWQPAEGAGAAGIGLTIHLAATRAMGLDGFLFYHEGAGEKGLLAGVELYLAKSKKPIAFGVFEWDMQRDKFGLLLGIALGLENLLGDDLPGFLADLAALTGTFFYGNKPDTLAIGQYNDPSTWLQFRFAFGGRVSFGISAAFCHHRVDEADALDPNVESVNVWALSLSMQGGGKLGPLGSLQVYLTVQVVMGQWRNEGMASGHQFVVEAGIRCKVFGCFNFGAHVKVDVAALGPGDPTYHRKSTIFRIETPWYLPDLTFRWESQDGTPVPEAMPVVSLPLASASAYRPAGPREAAAIGVTRPAGDLGDGPTYALRALRDAAPASPSDADLAALRPVAVDSVIALDLGASCDAWATALPSTTSTAGGAQRSNDLEARYEIVEIGVRRRRRFGDGVWRDLLDPLTTRVDALGGLSAEEIEARFRPVVTFDWDPDVHRVGRVDPRRLLVNADTPYTFATRNPEADEIVAATLPGWPCCRRADRPVRWHIVHFHDTPPGARTPAIERFSESASTLRWVGGRPPVVVPPQVAPGGANVAAVDLGARPAGVIAAVSFDEPAAICEVYAAWKPIHSAAALVVEAYRGLDVVASLKLAISDVSPPAPIQVSAPEGMTSLLLRKEGDIEPDSGEPPVELISLRYRTLREAYEIVLDLLRCDAQDERVHGAGRLGWLPNTDYEITLRTRVVLGYAAAGDQDAVIEQKAYFRTRGPLGLNASAFVGEEIDPYVESRYPAPADRLYRAEALAVAFDERLNVLLPVDRAPAPGEPEERQQLVRWVLVVDKVGGAAGLERISQTVEDWIVAHRGAPSPPSPPTTPPRRPRILDAGVLSAPIRRAPSTDPRRLRLENMMARPGACAAPRRIHASQLLVHQPVDPGAPAGAPARWEPDEEYRVSVRAEGAPFIDRGRFEPEDATACTFVAESGAAAAWTVDDGALRPVAFPPGDAAQLALVGDGAGWDHVEVRATVDPEGGEAGIAIAVLGAPVAQAILALIDERGGARRLRLVERRGGVVRELAARPLADDAPRPYVLEVTSYDDRVRAAVGDVVVQPDEDRGAVRGGRIGLCARGGGRFAGLAVQGLDVWRAHLRTSRYVDFPAHIDSWDGALPELPLGVAGAPTTTVAALLAEDARDIAAAMAAGADAEARDALFRRWVAALSVPLRERPSRLALTRLVAGGATELLLLESPEPLAFSRDVTLSVHRRASAPEPAPTPPRWPPSPIRGRPRPSPFATFLEQIELADDALLVPPIPGELRALRRLVRAERARGERVRDERVFHVYELPPRVDPTVTNRAPRVATLVPGDRIPESYAALGPDELGLFDERNRPLLAPEPIPEPPAYAEVPVVILGSGDELRALVIPVGPSGDHAPFEAGVHRFRFAIDRARWRSETADDVSRYRAASTRVVGW
ncbi:hypothetical protein [Sorangium sp. So ce406]|uniref:hypothetical protein n=1 Tax=Sorangium sp. So ce406 TaxID=3133311 RepID=UPI003F5ADF15